MFWPMFTKAASGGASPMVGTIGPPSRPLGGMRLSQVPEKSILPFGSRGGGASRFGLPSAVFGTSERTNGAHCAERVTEAANSVTTALISPSQRTPHGRPGPALFCSTNRCARRFVTISAV